MRLLFYSKTLLKEYSGLSRASNKIDFVSTMILFTFARSYQLTKDVTMNQDAYVYHTESIIREYGDLNFDFEILDRILIRIKNQLLS